MTDRVDIRQLIEDQDKEDRDKEDRDKGDRK